LGGREFTELVAGVFDGLSDGIKPLPIASVRGPGTKKEISGSLRKTRCPQYAKKRECTEFDVFTQRKKKLTFETNEKRGGKTNRH